MQRPQGQHDDLARLPRARSRQGSHRRSATPRNGSRPSLRHASRVVAAASGARTSPAVARDSNRVSADTERRRQETGFRGPETKAPKRPPKSNCSFAETKRRRHAPPIRGRSPLAGKSLRTWECVVVCAVKYEPVSICNSLLTGKRTGNFAISRLSRPISSQETAAPQSLLA